MVDIPTTAKLFDVVVIGGGLNGCAIARDAVGRGLRVMLVEKRDFGGNLYRRLAETGQALAQAMDDR